MKADFSLIENNDDFMMHTHLIGGEMVYLIQPKFIGAKWTNDNLMFRSSVWDTDGNPVSLSFTKFVNWGEKPELFPVPTSLKGAHLLEKLDGSTLIFSRWKGNTVIRTRGTVDARKQENGHEIDVLMAKYPKFVAELEKYDTTTESYIFEWQSPSNVIVINYGAEPDMVLIGITKHSDYSYTTQATLDNVAKTFGLRRPQSFSYDSIDEMKASVEAFKGMEGLCVYFHGDQKILKVKAAAYLFLHRAKSEISSVEKVLDLWIDQGKMPYQEFYEFVVKTFDYEIAEMGRGHMSRICDAWKDVQAILNGFDAFVEKVKYLSRKEAAEKILQAYGQTNRASFVFAKLDGKALTNDQLKKLMFQCLKQ